MSSENNDVPPSYMETPSIPSDDKSNNPADDKPTAYLLKISRYLESRETYDGTAVFDDFVKSRDSVIAFDPNETTWSDIDEELWRQIMKWFPAHIKPSNSKEFTRSFSIEYKMTGCDKSTVSLYPVGDEETFVKFMARRDVEVISVSVGFGPRDVKPYKKVAVEEETKKEESGEKQDEKQQGEQNFEKQREKKGKRKDVHRCVVQ